MAVIKEKILEKKTLLKPTLKPAKKESTLQRISREMDEKEVKDIQDAKDKIIADKVEAKRKSKIIKSYLDKLEENLKDKNHFWIFADRAGFKKIYMNTDDMMKMLKNNVEKYKNRPLVDITIIFHQNEKNTSIHRKSDVWLSVNIVTYYLDENCKLAGTGYGNGNMNGSINIGWKTPDFKITKFTMKLIKELTYRAYEKKFDLVSFGGLSVSILLKNAKKAGIILDDFLVPLAGI